MTQKVPEDQIEGQKEEGMEETRRDEAGTAATEEEEDLLLSTEGETAGEADLLLMTDDKLEDGEDEEINDQSKVENESNESWSLVDTPGHSDNEQEPEHVDQEHRPTLQEELKAAGFSPEEDGNAGGDNQAVLASVEKGSIEKDSDEEDANTPTESENGDTDDGKISAEDGNAEGDSQAAPTSVERETFEKDSDEEDVNTPTESENGDTDDGEGSSKTPEDDQSDSDSQNNTPTESKNGDVSETRAASLEENGHVEENVALSFERTQIQQHDGHDDDEDEEADQNERESLLPKKIESSPSGNAGGEVVGRPKVWKGSDLGEDGKEGESLLASAVSSTRTSEDGDQAHKTDKPADKKEDAVENPQPEAKAQPETKPESDKGALTKPAENNSDGKKDGADEDPTPKKEPEAEKGKKKEPVVPFVDESDWGKVLRELGPEQFDTSQIEVEEEGLRNGIVEDCITDGLFYDPNIGFEELRYKREKALLENAKQNAEKTVSPQDRPQVLDSEIVQKQLAEPLVEVEKEPVQQDASKSDSDADQKVSWGEIKKSAREYGLLGTGRYIRFLLFGSADEGSVSDVQGGTPAGGWKFRIPGKDALRVLSSIATSFKKAASNFDEINPEIILVKTTLENWLNGQALSPRVKSDREAYGVVLMLLRFKLLVGEGPPKLVADTPDPKSANAPDPVTNFYTAKKWAQDMEEGWCPVAKFIKDGLRRPLREEGEELEMKKEKLELEELLLKQKEVLLEERKKQNEQEAIQLKAQIAQLKVNGGHSEKQKYLEREEKRLNELIQGVKDDEKKITEEKTGLDKKLDDNKKEFETNKSDLKKNREELEKLREKLLEPAALVCAKRLTIDKKGRNQHVHTPYCLFVHSVFKDEFFLAGNKGKKSVKQLGDLLREYQPGFQLPESFPVLPSGLQV